MSNSEPPENKLNSLKRARIEPVQHRLLNHYVFILRVLANGRKGINETFKQLQQFRAKDTSLSHKQYVTNAIYDLEKGNLIKGVQQIGYKRKKKERGRKKKEGKVQQKDAHRLGL